MGSITLMAKNDFKAFATDRNANVMSQEEWEALPALLSGFTAGKASSAQVNKVIRQASFIAAALAQFVSDKTQRDVLDNGDLPGFVELLGSGFAVEYLSRKNPFGDIKSDGTVQTALENLGLRESFSGVVGQSRNARMSVAAASATATFSADELIVEDGDGRQYRLSNFNKSVDLMKTGAGGMDTGTVPATGFVALYAIYNPATDMSSLLAVNATSAEAPEIYGGSSLPPDYTASALVSVWGISESKFKAGTQHGRVINIDRQTAITTTATVNTLTELSIAAIVPKNARKVSGYGSIYATSGDEKSGGLIIDVASTNSGVGYVSIGGYVGNFGIGVYGQFAELLLSTPQSIFYDVNPNGTSITGFSASIFISGYTI